MDEKKLKVEDRHTIETITTKNKVTVKTYVNKTDKSDNLFAKNKKGSKSDEPPAPKMTYNKTTNFVKFAVHRKRITSDKSGQDKIIACPSHNDWSYAIYNKTDGKNYLWDHPKMWDVKIFGDCSVASPEKHEHFYHELNKARVLIACGLFHFITLATFY